MFTPTGIGYIMYIPMLSELLIQEFVAPNIISTSNTKLKDFISNVQFLKIKYWIGADTIITSQSFLKNVRSFVQTLPLGIGMNNKAIWAISASQEDHSKLYLFSCKRSSSWCIFKHLIPVTPWLAALWLNYSSGGFKRWNFCKVLIKFSQSIGKSNKIQFACWWTWMGANREIYKKDVEYGPATCLLIH